jgi:hypothetical protein
VPQPNGKQQNIAGPQLDSFGVDSRFETARYSPAFSFCALTIPETWDRATTTTESHNFTVGIGAISAKFPL